MGLKMRFFIFLSILSFALGGMPSSWTKRWTEFMGQFDGVGHDYGWWMKPKPVPFHSHSRTTLYNSRPKPDETDNETEKNLEDTINDVMEDIRDSPEYDGMQDKLENLFDTDGKYPKSNADTFVFSSVLAII